MLRSLAVGACIVLAVVIYAYGFEVTQINLDEAREPRRQEQLVRILRALAQPDILEYDTEEFVVNAPIQVPCVTNAPAPEAPAANGPYLVLTPPCADPGAEITVEGFNFEPNTAGPLNFIPPSGVSLQMGRIETDANGYFTLTARLPRRESEETQFIRAVTRRNVGSPHFSQSAIDTWDKIVETVFLALLATTLGTVFSIPASFLAARNLMEDVTSPLISVALTILALPFGVALGAWAANAITQLAGQWISNVWGSVAVMLIGPMLIWAITRWALPPVEQSTPNLSVRFLRLLGLLLAAILGAVSVFSLGGVLRVVGDWGTPQLGTAGFLGTFINDLGDIVQSSLTLVAAVAGGGVLVSAAGRLGQTAVERLSTVANRLLSLLLAVLAGAVLFAGIGAALDWLYQIGNTQITLLWPGLIGAVLGFLLALRLPAQAPLPIGLVVYNIARTIFNVLRSIESLVMVIVFAVWVGIGPFAGVLALALHTIASLAKLYSEQIESIMAGPLEAIRATGATRLQTIVYAVIPQIIPPFISYTMYRWDINVRMSTIIGFAGGGGIGFLLQQNINVLNYRAAATQMLAIAVVVMAMDYISSYLRKKAI